MRLIATMSNVAGVAVTATAAMVAVAGIGSALAVVVVDRRYGEPGFICSESATASSCPPGQSMTVTENGVRFSFTVPDHEQWAGQRFSSVPTNKSPGGPISLNKSIAGPQGAEGIIYWTSFPNGDYADPCARLLGRSVGRSAADLAAAVCDSARHQARQGAFGRDPGRAPREVRVAQRSQERRLRPWVLLHLARRVRRCVVADDGSGRHDPGLDRRCGRDAPLHRSRDKRQANGGSRRRSIDRRIDQVRLATGVRSPATRR